jgi:hypothetical protein
MSMKRNALPGASVLVLALACSEPSAAQPARDRLSRLPAAEIHWPSTAPTQRYDVIDGDRMKGYVEELAAISHRSRDAGNQRWGRIAGTPSGAETQRWMADKFKQAGLEVTIEEFTLSPQAVPVAWAASVQAGHETVRLTSASPIITFDRYMASAQGSLDLEAVWVGLGMASDFVGKDVRGKAVFIYSVPTLSSLIQSASWMGSLRRAQEAGAAAILVVLAIPGNMSFVSHVQGLSTDIKVPVFTVGLDEGEKVEALNASLAAADRPLRAHLEWSIETATNVRAANVVGMLRGQTDENIVIISHTDGFFEGANDNAAGTASMLGLAEYFASRPVAERRRNLYFIATADHHTGDRGGEWIHEHLQPVLQKAAFVANAEHVAVMEPVWDRPWGSNVRPELYVTNQLGSSWWGVYGSDRFAAIVRDSFAAFGVPTHLEQGGSAGQLRPVQWDAPSFYLHNKGVYYHSSADTPAIVPAQGLRTATQAFARIVDEVNKLELKDLRSPAE